MISPFPKIIDLEFTQVELHENYIISTIKEGVLFDHPQKTILSELFDTYYNDKPLVYIGIRKNDYTVNPTCYINSYNSSRLIGVAIVCAKEKSMQMANYEKQFFEGPFKVFTTLDEAKAWCAEIQKNRLAS